MSKVNEMSNMNKAGEMSKVNEANEVSKVNETNKANVANEVDKMNQFTTLRASLKWVAIFFLVMLALYYSETAWSQLLGSGFESRMKGLTNQLMTVILPLISVLGLVYAVILALTGDGAAKGRIIMVIVCSIVGFLAPHIISWFQAAVGY